MKGSRTAVLEAGKVLEVKGGFSTQGRFWKAGRELEGRDMVLIMFACPVPGAQPLVLTRGFATQLVVQFSGKLKLFVDCENRGNWKGQTPGLASARRTVCLVLASAVRTGSTQTLSHAPPEGGALASSPRPLGLVQTGGAALPLLLFWRNQCGVWDPVTTHPPWATGAWSLESVSVSHTVCGGFFMWYRLQWSQTPFSCDAWLRAATVSVLSGFLRKAFNH